MHVEQLKNIGDDSHNHGTNGHDNKSPTTAKMCDIICYFWLNVLDSL